LGIILMADERQPTDEHGPHGGRPRTLLDTDQLAARLGVAAITVRKWRLRGGDAGPPWVKCGPRSVRYRLEDVDAWVARRTVASTSESI
jgi:predicted DNA-binding transcriptional regulator AlpA